MVKELNQSPNEQTKETSKKIWVKPSYTELDIASATQSAAGSLGGDGGTTYNNNPS